MKKILKRLPAIALAAVTALSLAACGGKDTESEEAKLPDFIYVPEYMELDGNGNYYSMRQAGDYLYYELNEYEPGGQGSKESIVRRSLKDGTSETIPVTASDEEYYMNTFQVGADGSLYIILVNWSYNESTGESSNQYYLLKKDASGNEIFREEISETMKQEGAEYVNSFAVDGQGRTYLTAETKVLLFDGEGKFRGSLDVGSGMGGWINGIGRGGDGKVYTYCYSYNGESGGYALQEIDFEKRAVAKTYEGFPDSSGNGDLVPGGESSFLVSNGTGVYEYSLETQTAELLFNWLDSDINGTYVNGIGLLEDGRILAMINDSGTGGYSVATLTKTPSSEIPQKELLVIGTLSSSSELTAAAVNFNKSSDKYRVMIKEYIDAMNWTETSYTDGINNFNNAIVSGNCPDIIDLSSLNVEQLVAGGALESVLPYLEGSGTLKKEDYLENILEGYTYDGVLVGIPKTFYVQTVVGSAADLGEEPGWTLAEIIQYANEHPKARLFDYGTRVSMMQTLLRYNEGQFVDWKERKCSFTSQEFLDLLEFVKRFPEEAEYDSEVSTPRLIERGEVLLDQVHLSDFRDIQMYNEFFKGKACFIGFPNADGGAGCAMYASGIFAISTKSKQKDGAWAFIESYLSTESERFSWGFPSNKVKLEEKLEEAVKVETYTWVDEDGVEHEEVASGGGSIGYGDGWTYEYHTPTREEAEQTMALIRAAKPRASQDSQIMSIITEEAEAFFSGQKSAAETADVIQRRAQTYVDENS